MARSARCLDGPHCPRRLRHGRKTRQSAPPISARVQPRICGPRAALGTRALKAARGGAQKNRARVEKFQGRHDLNHQAKKLHIPVEHTTLSNGLRVVASPDHSAPVVTVGVYYQIGFRLEPRGRSGFAHLFEHMMFQGSENAGKMEHIRLINSSGGLLNGTTNYDITNYFEAVPSNALERVLWLEADRM